MCLPRQSEFACRILHHRQRQLHLRLATHGVLTRPRLTLVQEVSKSRLDVGRFGSSDGLGLLVVNCLDMRPEIVRGESEADREASISVDKFLFTEDGIREGGLEGAERLYFGAVGTHYADLYCVVRIGTP